MAVILNIEMPECCDQCLFGCWSNLHQTAECYLMSDTQMFDDFSTKYKTRRSVNCPMEEHAPNVDAIYRQAAIDAINSYFGFNIEEEYGSAVQEVINGLPSAQPERKKGKWISKYTGKPVKVINGIPQDSCYCSVCGEWLTASDEYDVNGNFCPNCGSDNREGI